MDDTLITGASIVDGTGRPAFTGNLSIRDGRIMAVGDTTGRPARQTIAADGGFDATGVGLPALRNQ